MFEILKSVCAEYASRANAGEPTDEVEIRIDYCVQQLFSRGKDPVVIQSIEVDGEHEDHVDTVYLVFEGGIALRVSL